MRLKSQKINKSINERINKLKIDKLLIKYTSLFTITEFKYCFVYNFFIAHYRIKCMSNLQQKFPLYLTENKALFHFCRYGYVVSTTVKHHT